MPDPVVTPIGVFASSGGIASLAGLAALLRSGKPLTWKSVTSALLNSGILGLVIALLWYSYFRDSVYFLVGLSALAGLGGTTMVDFAIQVLKTWISKHPAIKDGEGEHKE